ncbi:MAG: hypothetical protein KJP25_02715 [Gammaproteobacteria bacterium]|nr:hypothetical protein [Gammaproteobacteria bacterium]NND38143.1 hypothetical protein [Pseudomonadales bacterium]NNL10984.1 hypothetical protein [Pseudomonadales bacterium]NNM11643.1 hypothetical protein [Pseudomonadales bacterium]RZV52463.1 MAG: hypothetical protein EX270_09475 [Pseudomonadales bacterium]
MGDKLGVSVDQITTDPDSGVQIITLSVPKELGEIQNVDIVDAKDRPLPMARDAKILQDYENNNIGVKVFLAPKSSVQFKLKLSTEQ